MLPRQTRQTWQNNFVWRQGEHILLIGPTGTGKTTLAHELLQLRDWVVVLAIKKADDVLEIFKNDHVLIKTWPPPYGVNRALLWAKPSSLYKEDLLKQRAILFRALDKIYQSGGWTVYFDDAGFMGGMLGLNSTLTVFLSQGRSSHISSMLSLTRPSSQLQHVPLETMTQIKHALLFRTVEINEHKRMAQIAGMPLKAFTAEMQSMAKHDFIAVSHGAAVVVTQ